MLSCEILVAYQTCGPNQEYVKCGSACPLTCKDVKHPRPKVCTMQCVSGCFCKSGYALNDSKRCVPKKDC
ncbi:Chymotrypsin-elastase inhibitor ixodidin [Trichuris trichiura]|uniref:Chymotrypsin-elastase inhibitor ixodidin n=1 Tax=Trichuris trichiura TaxID=36087 RepID=A0A077ZDY0_TRITR|nr:Chymotrypsin-elastase inhibitor ixodidin [Trichuris trichiura]